MGKSIFLHVLFLFLLSGCHSNKTQVEPIEAVKDVDAVKSVNLNETMPLETQLLHKQLSDSVFARIERTPCFGRCPTYILTVYKDGTAYYEGKNFVDSIGNFEAKVDASKLILLMNEAEKIQFFDLKNNYDNEHVTDLPATLTTLKGEGTYKTIINRYEGPEELHAFQNFFDSLFEAVKWQRVPDEQNK